MIEKGYEVHGIIRKSSTFNTQRIMHIFQDLHEEKVHLFLHYGDFGDPTSLDAVIYKVLPDEIYHLGAQSHVRVSFDIPNYTLETIAPSTLQILNTIKNLKGQKKIRFYHAASSEMFGSTAPPQNEDSKFYPRSPYAAAKVCAYWMTINFREAFGLHASNGILFNHESSRRGETFVTRKITRGIAQIMAKKAEKIYLGNLDAKRDWGYAKEYVEAMWLMLQQDKPDDYVIATGQSHSVKDFLVEAFGLCGLDWQKYVEFDARYVRPTEVDSLKGDPTKARKKLGWNPKVEFKQLVRLMLESDLKRIGLELPNSK